MSSERSLEKLPKLRLPGTTVPGQFSTIDTTIIKTSRISSVFHKLCRCFSKQRNETAEEMTLLPPDKNSSKKTLVLDLDETLVHSSIEAPSEYDLKLNVRLEASQVDIYVCLRPWATEFLKKVAEKYEVVIFTASLREYADPVIEFIDHEKVVSSRLFRTECLSYNGFYIKNLSYLGRDLKKVVIVDNSPISYTFHPYNAVAIRSWYNDKTDRELEEVYNVLMSLSNVEDIPKVIRSIDNQKLELTVRNIDIVVEPLNSGRSLVNSPKPNGEQVKFTFESPRSESKPV